MRALKIIPILLFLLFLVYMGVLFVEANQEPVIISLGRYETIPMRLGFVLMTSALIGIIAGALLASAQIGLLLFQNRSLKKKLERAAATPPFATGDFTERAEVEPERDPFAP